MRRSRVLGLRAERWVRPIEGDDLEIAVLPAGTQDVLLGGPREACRSVFVNFRGYTDDDGKPIPNDIEARLELYLVSAVRQAVNRAVQEAQTEIERGESPAAPLRRVGGAAAEVESLVTAAAGA